MHVTKCHTIGGKPALTRMIHEHSAAVWKARHVLRRGGFAFSTGRGLACEVKAAPFSVLLGLG